MNRSILINEDKEQDKIEKIIVPKNKNKIDKMKLKSSKEML